ncbi:MAG: TIGR01906 family membrane protein, partial [Anaerolineaceae bacterium]|nr:TIGR01906 family membrane protein [Anaerolineaceae bacterium]
MINPLFGSVEYQMPNFPSDAYGFEQAERLDYANDGINYLTDDKDINFLGALTFKDGSPLFKDRELSHMVDVKVLIGKALSAWYGATFLLGLLTIWAKQTNRWHGFRSVLGFGGKLTIGLLILGGISLAISFDWLFTQFHYLFFEGDTWLFYTSDTLIRLYPMRFWQDAFITVFGLTLIGAVLLIWQGKKNPVE